MRTKTLALSVALGVAGMVGSYAQVYSVNAVGYINLQVQPGWQMIANQLDNKAGNKVVDLLKGLPDQTTLYKYVGGSYKIMTYYVDPVGGDIWDGQDMTVALAPGEGAWLFNPQADTKTVTFVGEVVQGTLTSSIPAGFSIMSSIVPKDLDMATEAEWPAEDGDMMYKWNRALNNGTGGYEIVTSYIDDSTTPPTVIWDAPAGITPTAKVGESFWMSKKTAKTWTRSFDVNSGN